MSRRGSATGTAPLGVRVAAATALFALVVLGALAVIAALTPDTDLATSTPSPLGWVIGTVIIVGQCVALLWRRTASRAVLLTAALGLLLGAISGLGDTIAAAQPAVLVAAYTLGLSPLARAWPTVVAAVLLVGAGNVTVASDAGEPWSLAISLGLAQGLGTVGLPLMVGLVVATRRESRLARESGAAALEREQSALVQAAVARERTAMARELHDIAAHHLSGIAVMSAAIGAQIDTDPAGAKAGIAQVRQQSRSVLRDLRSLVGLLRDDETDSVGGTGERIRPESLAGVTALVEELTAAGRDISLTVLDGPTTVGDDVGPLAQLAAYRMVQEALANAAGHAPGTRAEVTLDNRGTEVVVTVRNGRPEPAPFSEDRQGDRTGFGLVGMRERAELTGCTLEVGPTADGGWEVGLRMPRERPVAQEDA